MEDREPALPTLLTSQPGQRGVERLADPGSVTEETQHEVLAFL